MDNKYLVVFTVILFLFVPLTAANSISDLSLFYRMNETSGSSTILDYSGNNIDGSVLGNPDFRVPGSSVGDDPYSMSFNKNSMVSTGNTNLAHGIENLTVSARINPDEPPSSSTETQRIVSKANSNDSNSFIFRYNKGLSTNGMVYFWSGGQSEAYEHSSFDLSQNGIEEFHHVVWRYNSGNSSIFLDGELISNQVFNTNEIDTSGSEVVVGGRTPAQDAGFLGDIDEVKIYEKSLTDEEIQTLNSTGSISDSSINSRPVIENISPGNNSLGVNQTDDSQSIDANLSVSVSDPDGDNLNVSFTRKNSIIAEFNNVSSGSTVSYELESLSELETVDWNANVTDGESSLQESYTFTTASSDNRTHIEFAGYGDPHEGSSKRGGANPGKLMTDLAERYVGSGSNFPALDFGLGLGDDTHFSAPGEWDAVTNQIYDDLKLPFSITLGNHDLTDYRSTSGSTEHFPQKGYKIGMNETGLNSITYSYVYNNVLFINKGDEGSTAWTNRKQRAFIKNEVQSNPDKTVVIFSHNVPGISPTKGKTDGSNGTYEQLNNYSYWRDIVNHDNVKLWVHGHNHRWAYHEAENITYIDVDSMNPELGTDQYSGFFNITSDCIKTQQWDEDTDSYTDSYSRCDMGDNKVVDTGMEEVTIPKKMQDGDTQSFVNHYVPSDVKVEFLGYDNANLAYLHDFQLYSDQGDPGGAPKYWGYTGTADAFGKPDEDYALLEDSSDLRAADSSYDGQKWTEGEIPWNMVRAVPGETYNITVWAKADVSNVADVLDVKTHWRKYNWSEDLGSSTAISNADLTDSYQRISGQVTAPSTQEAEAELWLLQIEFITSGSNNYRIQNYSVTASNQDSGTKSFNVSLNGQKVQSGVNNLGHLESKTVDVSADILEQKNKLSAEIGGNNVGVVNVVLENPKAFSKDLSVGIDSHSGDQWDLDLGRSSRYSSESSLVTYKGMNTSISGAGFTKTVFDEGERQEYYSTSNNEMPSTAAFSTSTIDEDLTPPFSSDNWTASGFVDKSEVDVELTATDDDSGVANISYSVNGEAFNTVSGSSTLVNINEQGNNTLEYYATDNAGNVEATNTEYVALNFVEPKISLNEPADGVTYAYPDYESDVSIDFNWEIEAGTDDGNTTLYINGNQATTENFNKFDNSTFSYSESLSAGEYTYYIEAETDNFAKESETRSFTVEQTYETRPELTLDVPESNAVYRFGPLESQAEVEFRYSINAGSEDGTSEIYLNGSLVNSEPFTMGTTDTYTYRQNLSAGNYEYFVKADTPLYNVESFTRSFTVEQRPMNRRVFNLSNPENGSSIVTENATNYTVDFAGSVQAETNGTVDVELDRPGVNGFTSIANFTVEAGNKSLFNISENFTGINFPIKNPSFNASRQYEWRLAFDSTDVNQSFDSNTSTFNFQDVEADPTEEATVGFLEGIGAYWDAFIRNSNFISKAFVGFMIVVSFGGLGYWLAGSTGAAISMTTTYLVATISGLFPGWLLLAIVISALAYIFMVKGGVD